MEEGIVDFAVPMVFFRQSQMNRAADFVHWSTFAKDHKYNRQLVISTGNYLNNSSNGVAQVRSVRETSPAGNRADGICIYSYHKPTAEDNSRESAFTEFSRSAPDGTPLFAHQAGIPEMPWKTKPAKGHLKGLVSGKTNTVDGATITISGTANRMVKSDATGFYGMIDLMPGNYTLIVSGTGLASQTNSVIVTAGKIATDNLTTIASAVR